MSSIFVRRLLAVAPALALAIVLAPPAQAAHIPHAESCAAAGDEFPIQLGDPHTDIAAVFVHTIEVSSNPLERWICFYTPVKAGKIVLRVDPGAIAVPEIEPDTTPGPCTTPILDLAGVLNVSVRAAMSSTGQLAHFACVTVNGIGASLGIEVFPGSAPVIVNTFFDF